MNILNADRYENALAYPEKVLQFGEGNFLRGFIDWMLQRMNDQGLFQGRSVVINPLPGPNPLTPYFHEQDHLYTLINRGVRDGQVINERQVIHSISRFLGSYEDFDAYMACAANPDLRFIISNTTEAGIAYAAADRFEDRPASSYPGKITQFLHARWAVFNGAADKGLIIMPCELIEANGTTLRSIILRYAAEWGLDPAFSEWVSENCIFLNTLVDRIVSGYPRAEEAELWSELGYVDHLMDAVEPFHLLVIEGPDLSEEFPLHKAGINVIWTSDQSAYRTRKVRILNGAHTMTTLGAYMAGLNTVEDFMKDPSFSSYMRQGLYEEIIPTMTLPTEELMAFAAAVEERFLNPFIHHQLMSIALNSVSKWKTRVLPSLLDQYVLNGTPSPCLSFSLAALIVFYRGRREDGTTYEVPDSTEVLAAFEEAWKLPVTDCVTALLSRADFWGQDLNALPQFTVLVSSYVANILENGVRAALPLSDKKKLLIHPEDSVYVALETIPTGTAVSKAVTTLQDIPAGHKIARHTLAVGDNVIKYGFPIGHATAPIEAGSWIHSHNLSTNLSGAIEYEYHPTHFSLPTVEPMTFMGYPRSDGQVGIRNEIWIVNTVGCVNKTAEILAREASALYGDRVDGIFAFPHPFGCSQLGDDHENTRRILADLVKHPNAAGVLVLSLGCENNTPESFRELLGDVDPQRVRFVTTQEVEDEITVGLSLLDELTAYAATLERHPFPASRLVIGLKCGGSDGFSGITANPLIGAVSDLLAAQGGTTVLSEVPEMFGAETILMDHARDEEVFQKIVSLINDFKDYFIRHGQVVYENPSPGNKEGGITTLEEKSLGCTQKGGRSDVQDVLQYGDRVSIPGLNLLQGPGNDIVACTALTAAGCHLILFSTGRGTPLGAPVPTVKIATNSALAAKKKNWIDYDAGILLENPDMDAASHELFQLILDIASGRVQTCNEKYGYREISILKDGVTL